MVHKGLNGAWIDIEDGTAEQLVVPEVHAAKVAAIKERGPDLFVNAGQHRLAALPGRDGAATDAALAIRDGGTGGHAVCRPAGPTCPVCDALIRAGMVSSGS